jgi:diacylglycerol O-acyltransferase / wax synthase
MPSTWQMLARGVASLPFQPVRAVLGSARAVPYLDQLMPFRVTPGAGIISGATRRMARLARLGGDGMLLQGDTLRVPKTVLDRPVTGRRRWAFTRVPLEDAKRIKNHFGGTLNDVVVAATAGAVRSWLLELGELPAAPLAALVPVSVRTGSNDSGGNLVQVMLVKLPTNEADPQVRLRRTHDALRAAKERRNAVPAAAMRGADELLMPALFIRAARAATLLAGLKGATANAVISNVPGSATEVYLAGSRVEALYPVGGLVEGFGFSTIVFSYSGGLDLGFVVDGDSPADPWRLAEAYDRSQRELLALVPDGLSG